MFDVLVVGEALIDIVESSTGRSEHVGGSPANVALGLGRLGVSVALLSSLADDPRGRAVIAHLESSAVAVLEESMTAQSTSTAIARIADDGRAEYTFDVAWPSLPRLEGVAPRLVHTGSIATFLRPGADSVRELLITIDAAEVTFDPNIRQALLGAHRDAVASFELTASMATVVKLSDEDAEWLYPRASPEEVLVRVLGLGPRLVVITLGTAGVLLASRGHRVRVPAVRVKLADTIGAGDTFMASLIQSLVHRGSADLGRDELERIGRAGVAAAAITVSRAGANLPWAHELGLTI